MSPQMSQLDAMKRNHDNLNYALGDLALLVLVLRGGMFSSLVVAMQKRSAAMARGELRPIPKEVLERTEGRDGKGTGLRVSSPYPTPTPPPCL